tara:strand:+ start:543 stop:1388 length:846 start_codon:yes stop_codon:yes gene_type:complete
MKKFKDKIRYGIDKYIPFGVKKIIFNILYFPKNILRGLQFVNFEYDLKKTSKLAQLSWATSDISSKFDNNSIFLKNIISYIEKSYSLKLESDENIKLKSSRQYEFEYLNMNNFPGEHYRLLAAICEVENLNQITEIGTGSGIACKVILNNSNAKINTVDIIPWDESNSHLTISEFQDQRITQIIADLSSKKTFEEYSYLFTEPDLIFLDAGKDGIFEDTFLKNLSEVELSNKNRLLLIDDIKYFTMYKVWKKIQSPKLDLSSFGHWSGTGIVDISRGLNYL